MADNFALGFNLFPLLNEASTNDAHRPGTVYLEYHDISSDAMSSGTIDVDVDTKLGSVIGVIPICAIADDDKVVGMSATDVTDGVSTVTVTSISGASTAKFVGGIFLVGTAKITSTISF